MMGRAPDEAIAMRLSAGQRSTLTGLSAELSVLGCAEPCARRLAKPTSTRPALVAGGTIMGEPAFRLTMAGLYVKRAIERAEKPDA